ncbi:MAG: hypothetical protein ABSD81_06020 [Methanomicrobiales archaeon]|jgi:hypothetical protein
MKMADAIFKWLCQQENGDLPFSNGCASRKMPDVVFEWLVASMKRLMPVSRGGGAG